MKFDDLTPEQVGLELRRICGWQAAEGKGSNEPSQRYGEELSLLAKVEPYVKIYPRGDIDTMPARERRQVDALLGVEALARWEATGEVTVIESTNCVESFGKVYNRPCFRVVPAEGCRLPAVLAGSLLRRYPLILSSLPKTDSSKESKKK